MRAIPLSSDSFREVASGLSAANEAMNQLSRIGRRSTKPTRGHDPTFDGLAFDDWMETIVSILMASKKYRYCNLFSRKSLYKAMNPSTYPKFWLVASDWDYRIWMSDKFHCSGWRWFRTRVSRKNEKARRFCSFDLRPINEGKWKGKAHWIIYEPETETRLSLVLTNTPYSKMAANKLFFSLHVN